MASQLDEQGSAPASQPSQMIDSDACKQMEEALRASEARFRAQFESAPMPTFIWQVAGQQFTLIDVNAAAERLTLGKARTFLGITAQQLYADQPDLLERFQACLEQQAVIVYETDYRARGTGLDRVIVFTFAYVSPELILLHADDITERKQAENAQRTGEANMIALLENTDGSIWSVDREYRLIAGNSVFQHNIRTALGRAFTFSESVLSCDDAGATNDLWRTYYDRALRGERFSVETQRRLTLPPNWYEYRLSPIYDRAGNVTGVTIFGRDITERKQAEEILRESEERFRLAFENANDGVCLVGLDGRLQRVNNRMCQIFGFSRQELECMMVNDLTHPDHLETSPQFIHRAVQEQGDQDTFEKLYLHRDGHRIWGRVSSSLVRSDRGEPLYFISHVQDISARKHAEEAARASEVQYRTLVEQASDGIFLANPEGRYIEVNSAGCQLLGYTREEILQRTMRDVTVIPTEAPLRLDELHSGKVFLSERTMIRKDGSRVSVEISAKQLADGRFQGIVRDISERKQAEEERARLQAQLMQAQKMETVGRLAGGIAHDFNNLLAVIMLRTELALQMADPSTPLHRSLTTIYATAQRSAELVRQLLGFARKQMIAPRVLDLNATIAATLPMLHTLIGEEIELAWYPGLQLWPVKLDPSQLDQILASLCVNARDAIGGVGNITIETENVELDQAAVTTGLTVPPGDYVMLAVTDNGSGMDTEILAHIFEPFFTTKDVGKGTGLGLATVDGIVQQNGGQITVYSKPGFGASFRVYLPRHGGEAMAPAANQPQELSHGHGETVLLVEDEAAVLQMGLEALELLGYKVIAATGPGAALHLAAHHAGKIDLLITDVVMPEMNGHALAEQVAVIQPGVKRLYVSGYPADFVAHRGVLEEGVHFLQKPFSLRALAAKVREVLAD